MQFWTGCRKHFSGQQAGSFDTVLWFCFDSGLSWVQYQCDYWRSDLIRRVFDRCDPAAVGVRSVWSSLNHLWKRHYLTFWHPLRLWSGLVRAGSIVASLHVKRHEIHQKALIVTCATKLTKSYPTVSVAVEPTCLRCDSIRQMRVGTALWLHFQSLICHECTKAWLGCPRGHSSLSHLSYYKPLAISLLCGSPVDSALNCSPKQRLHRLICFSDLGTYGNQDWFGVCFGC